MDNSKDNEDALDILVGGLFKGAGVVVDSGVAGAMRERMKDMESEYPEEGERGAATIMLSACAVNASMIPVLEKWGPDVGIAMMEKILEMYRAMRVKNGTVSH